MRTGLSERYQRSHTRRWHRSNPQARFECICKNAGPYNAQQSEDGDRSYYLSIRNPLSFSWTLIVTETHPSRHSVCLQGPFECIRSNAKRKAQIPTMSLTDSAPGVRSRNGQNSGGLYEQLWTIIILPILGHTRDRDRGSNETEGVQAKVSASQTLRKNAPT